MYVCKRVDWAECVIIKMREDKGAMKFTISNFIWNSVSFRKENCLIIREQYNMFSKFNIISFLIYKTKEEIENYGEKTRQLF